jgi:hypothetical protein
MLSNLLNVDKMKEITVLKGNILASGQDKLTSPIFQFEKSIDAVININLKYID